MEPILGLLGSGGCGIGGLSEKTSLNATKVEKDYMDIQKEAELELGLGLSLGGGGGGGGGAGMVKGKGSAAPWGEYGRILTAKDFTNGFCAGTKRERAAADSDVEAGTASTGVSQVVGWPPLRAYRMTTLVNQAKNSSVEGEKGVGGNEKNVILKKKINHGSNKNETCTKERIHPWLVKVNMDGLQIGRKVDLNAHMSYETLAKTLEDMFLNPASNIHGGKEQSMHPPKLLDATSEFVLTYEDKEGDWMLVGDVPWGMFMNTVKRLKIMRTSEANGLGSSKVRRKE